MTTTAEHREVAAATRRAKTLRKLVTAVEGLIGEGEDYTALSVERIIGRADVARSTFYAHYDGKGPLLRAVGESVISRVIDSSRGWSGLADDAGRPELREAMAQIVRTYREHAALMGAMAEVSAYDAEVRQAFGRIITLSQAELTAHARQGQQTGAVRADIDPAVTVRWLTWMVERCCHQLVGPARDTDLEAHVDALTGIVWSSLYEGAPTRPR